MEILFVSHKYPPTVGGMEKQSFELVTGMERYCKVHRIVYDGCGSRFAFFLKLKNRILRLCQEHPGVEIIHFNDALLAAFCLCHTGYEHLKRTVTLHGLDVVFPSETYRKYILPKFNRYDHFIAVSRATALHAIALGISENKISVISNGVDMPADIDNANPVTRSELLGSYGIPADKRILVAIGRPVKRKGFSWFIREVVPRLNKSFFVIFIGPFDKHPGFLEQMLRFIPRKLREKVMLFLGFGSDAAEIRALLNSGRYDTSVKHVGLLSVQQKQMLLSYSDGFIMPNIQLAGDMEGFGLVCLEAALAGTLVFAANIDGIPDAVQHGKNGFLLPGGVAETWASQLNELADNSTKFQLQRLIFQRFTKENYSWDKMVKAYYDLFLTIQDPQPPKHINLPRPARSWFS